MAGYSMDWPAALPIYQGDFFLDQPSRTGGMSISGSEQIISSPVGRWRAEVTVAVKGEASNLALRAFLGNLEGRVGTVLVPKIERYRPRDVQGRMFSQLANARYGRDGFNFDLSGLGQDASTDATLAESAALGDTRLSVNLLNGDGPQPGHYIGIGDRLYRCQNSWQLNEGEATTLQIWPRLRSDASADTRVILDRPVCLMRLAEDDGGASALSRSALGQITLKFVEAV